MLYVGNDMALSKSLQDMLPECQTIRCPNGSGARYLIKGINYSLLMIDKELPDMAGKELADFTRSLSDRKLLPIIILSTRKARCADANIFFLRQTDLKLLVRAIKHLLAAAQ